MQRPAGSNQSGCSLGAAVQNARRLLPSIKTMVYISTESRATTSCLFYWRSGSGQTVNDPLRANSAVIAHPSIQAVSTAGAGHHGGGWCASAARAWRRCCRPCAPPDGDAPRIRRRRRRLHPWFLPVSGAQWVCACLRGASWRLLRFVARALAWRGKPSTALPHAGAASSTTRRLDAAPAFPMQQAGQRCTLRGGVENTQTRVSWSGGGTAQPWNR